jgi:hypothetical protein
MMAIEQSRVNWSRQNWIFYLNSKESYCKNVGHPQTLSVLLRVSHVSVDVWEDTMAAPRCF